MIDERNAAMLRRFKAIWSRAEPVEKLSSESDRATTYRLNVQGMELHNDGLNCATCRANWPPLKVCDHGQADRTGSWLFMWVVLPDGREVRVDKEDGPWWEMLETKMAEAEAFLDTWERPKNEARMAELEAARRVIWASSPSRGREVDII